MADIVKRLCAPVSDDDDYMIGQWPGEPPKKYDALRLEAADEIKRLRAEVETWVGHAKTAIWSDSEECKLLTADNERLRAEGDKARARGDKLRMALEDIAYGNPLHNEDDLLAIARAALEVKYD